MDRIKYVCEKDKCTACGSCLQICPNHCISYTSNLHETKAATISQSECKSCHLCEAACPQVSIKKGKEPIKCFAAWSKDKEERRTSASGGIATEIYKYFASIGGYYAGASMNKDFSCTFKLYESTKYVGEFKNSKYVYSDTADVYSRIAEILIREKEMVFIGLPCQVAGLKQYLNVKHINQSKLFLVDIVCHGIAPDEFLKKHIYYVEKKTKRKADEVYFRDPDAGTHTFTFSLKDNKGTFYKKKVHRTDTYQVGYHNGIIYRDNCYKCRYACAERQGDLTISDFSGLGKILPFNLSHRGVSCILVNTDRGQKLLDILICKDAVCAYERPLEEALNYEKQLIHPTPESNLRRRFIILYEQSFDFEYALQKAATSLMRRNELIYYSHVEEIRDFISAAVPKKLKKRLKSILK